MTQMRGPNPRNRRAAERRGRRAETIAALLLRLKGYRILARRYRCPAGEADLIVRRGNLVAAVEVKARDTLAAAAESVTAQQRQRIAAALAQFTAMRDECRTCDLRFDAVLIAPRTWPRHIADAWRPGV